METIDTSSVEQFLQPFLPKNGSNSGLDISSAKSSIFVTATWAQSLDGRIAAAPGKRTLLSGNYSKKMTHFLRAKHDAILVGKNTLIVDDPSLQCRYSADSPSPRPVILDSQFAWDIGTDWKVLGNDLKPWVIVDRQIDEKKASRLRERGGEVLKVHDSRDWSQICEVLHKKGITSLMVEGGAQVLDSCLQSGLVDSIIITVAPVFLGKDGVDVAPSTAFQLDQVSWWCCEAVRDSVLASRMHTEDVGVDIEGKN